MTPDPTLTDEELATVTQWVDAGEPLAAHYARSIIAALRASRDEVDRLRKLHPEGPCPVGGTAPPQPTTYDGGYWYDGGFHHCSCGAVVPWTGIPHEGGVVEPHDYP